MNLPIKFHNHADVITEEVARFRKLSPEARVRELNEMYRLYQFLIANSGRPETLARLANEDEERNRRAIEEFAARHG